MITYPNALDENGNVHNIGAITPENRDEHRYYCLGCDKEMIPVLCGEGRTSHFRHKVNDQCNPETYLHNLAKKSIAKQFETQPKFEVSYYATNKCPKVKSCQIYRSLYRRECFGARLYTFDLKAIYDTCTIEGVYNGYRADVLLTNSQKSNLPPVFLEISVSHDCTQEKINSGIHIIELKVHDENDISCPIVENCGKLVPPKNEESFPVNHQKKQPDIKVPSVRFYNFVRDFHHSDVHLLDRFTLLKDGRVECAQESVSCGEWEIKHLKDAAFEINHLNLCKTAKRRVGLFEFSIANALLKDYPVRHCIYCNNYPSCRIPVNVERHNPRVGKKVVERIMTPIRAVNADRVNMRQLAGSCCQWDLNIRHCKDVINSFDDSNVFIWEAPAEEIIIDNYFI